MGSAGVLVLASKGVAGSEGRITVVMVLVTGCLLDWVLRLAGV